MRTILTCLLVVFLFFTSCDPYRVFETNATIKNKAWNLNDRPLFSVNITDTISLHTIYFNIRNTGNYKYNNIFILLTIQAPGSEAETQRFEFRLANPDGQWLGSGLGDIYSNQIKMIEGIKFPRSGTYTFTIEQNMRDNPLQGIEDIGIRIEKEKIKK